MNIQRVSIEGFKSFKELQMSSELSPGLNLVLGQNGRGKSNFLQAIIFALSDSFGHKTKQEKRQMLHEGEQRSNVRRGHRDANVYAVEVILDNSSNMIPVDAKELTVRKTYNCDTDKEDYYFNGKHITHKDLFNLFESGGYSFSSQTQFQIVQQGEVEKLVVQGEDGFLKMLKDVTGTSTFDNRLEKMNSVLEECQTKKDQLKKTLDAIQARLVQLGQEIEEYREIQQIEYQKKALELALHMNKLQGNNAKVAKLKEQKSKLMESREGIIGKKEQILMDNSQQRQQMEHVKTQIYSLESKFQALLRMKNDLKAQSADNQNIVSQKKAQSTMYDYFSNTYDQQMKGLHHGIEQLKRDVKSAEEQREAAQSEIEKVKTKQREVAREKDFLLLRKETAEKFKNPQQKKKFFQEEQNKIQVQMATILKDRNDTTKVIDLNKTKVQDLETKGKAKEQELGQVREAMKAAQAQMEAARDEKRQVAGLLKQQMFTQSEVEREVQSLKTKFNAEVGVLEKMEPIFTTLRRLRSMALEKGLPGFRGLFLDFIDCPAQFTPCIDIAAKSRLFSFIVEDLDSAKELLKLNTQVKGGVIDIFPLSMIENNEEKLRRYPDPSYAVPLKNHIKLRENADPRLQKLISQFFAKVVLVKNYQLAMDTAKEFNLTCITPDLQVVYAGAFITKVGHYNKTQQDRVAVYEKVSRIQREVEAKVGEAFSMQRARDGLNDKDLEALRKIQKAEVSLNNLKSTQQQLSTMLFEYDSQISQRKQQIKEQQIVLENLHRQEEEFKSQNQTLEQEKNKPEEQKFSEEDQRRLVVINKALDDLEKHLKLKQQDLLNIQAQLDQNMTMLQHNYLKRQNDLKIQKANQEIENDVQGLLSAEDDNLIAKEQESIDRELAQVREDQKRLHTQLQAMLEKEELELDQEIVLKDLRQKTLEVGEISMKIDEYQMRNHDIAGHIRRIENFDKDLFERVKKTASQQELLQEISMRGKELERYPRMNRHCVEWFDKYNSKHVELLKKFNDQDETEKGIFRLLQDLDTQKQQALERNFKTLNSNFAEIFQRLVPLGKAELKLIKSDKGEESQISHPSQFQESSQVMRIGTNVYKGVKVKVSFSGAENELEGLSHLSGGQKAVVASALLFSILKIQASPFYIMDEFDSALDAEYRGAIAQLIFELSKKSQFLITTFKPELIEGADKIFQIDFVNRVSDMKEINKEQAQEIIRDLGEVNQ